MELALAFSLVHLFPLVFDNMHFSVTDYAGLGGLKRQTVDMAGVIGNMETPPDIDSAMWKYTSDMDGTCKKDVLTAWRSAEEAKKLAETMNGQATKATLSFDSKGQVSLEIESSFWSNGAEVKAKYSEAITSAYGSFYSMLDPIIGDVNTLDEMGADNDNYTGAALRGYLAARDLVQGMEKYRTRSEMPAELSDELSRKCYDESAVEDYDIKLFSLCMAYRTSAYHSLDYPEFPVENYNMIVGYSGNSSLKKYSELHVTLNGAMASMRDEYGSAEELFVHGKEALSGLVSGLKSEDADLVTDDELNVINGALEGRLAISPSGPGSPAERLRELEDFLGSADFIRSRSDRIYKSRTDDWLFLSTEQLRIGAEQISERADATKSLFSDLSFLADSGREAFDELMAGTGEGLFQGAFYDRALQLRKRALSAATLGKKTAAWADGIAFLLVVNGKRDPSATLSNIGAVIKDLKLLGYDVSAEEDLYGRLSSRLDSPEEWPRIEMAAQQLEDKLDLLEVPALKAVERLRADAEDLLLKAESFLSDACTGIDVQDVRKLRQAYGVSLTAEPSGHAAELMQTYEKIISKLGSALETAVCPYETAGLHDWAADAAVSGDNKTSAAPEKNASLKPDKAAVEKGGSAGSDKQKLELKSRILRVCLFADCGALLEEYDNCGDDCVQLFLDAEKASESVLNGFSSYGDELDSLADSLADLKRAVDTDVKVNYSVDLVYTEGDYNRAKDEQKRLKSIGKLVDALSVSPGNSTDKLERLLKSFSSRDLQKYQDDIVSLSGFINSSISALEQEASYAVSSAKNRSADKALFEAQQAYNEGYYNRAIIYASGVSGFAPEKAKSPVGLPLHYFAMAAILCGFTAFILKKPKPRPLPPRQII